jgi:predicted small metal-binding protein
MTKVMSCKELGIRACDFTAKGETAGDVVQQVVEHVRAQHDIDIPDAAMILSGEVKHDPLEVVQPEISMVVQRLTKALDLVPVEEPELPVPPLDVTRPE